MAITNRLQLIKALRAKGVRDSAYSVSKPIDMAICLEQSGDEWAVFYYERGQRTPLKTFTNEAEACEFMFNEVLNDKTAFIK